ncbi:MAG: hypothetical protein EP344_17080 [Bacteroidetes bacterium]|nr:MAG: hypothetical protein EP344_17080 [Bacteroidota bacterium]
MSKSHLFLVGLGLLTILLSPGPLQAIASPGDSARVLLDWLLLAEADFSTLQQAFRESAAPKQQRLKHLNTALAQPEARLPEIGYPLLLEKIQLEEDLRILHEQADLQRLRLRYRKSIDMLKLLYEKILSMDHHFTSLRTNHQILRISNPHTYPEFTGIRRQLEDRLQRRFHFTLPAFMGSNPYLSAMYSLAGLALGGGNRLEQDQMERLSCILDFTVRMHQDLNIIYYETEYLCDANLTLKKECEALFAECTRQVGYTTTLPDCRTRDNWETLYSHLETYIEAALQNDSGTEIQHLKMYANLQFAIDRIVHFLEQYSAFVNQGNAYYKKFARIIANYDNLQTCASALPASFHQLKGDIDITLLKFNSAYALPEIQGSRLKDLLYGIGD